MPVPIRDIGDDEVLTQYGKEAEGQATFHTKPRTVDRDALSVIVGDLTAQQTCVLVNKGICYDHGTCRVRSVTAGILRLAGFTVRHAPTKRNPAHARVTVASTVTWDGGVAQTFDLCFQDVGSVADEGRDGDV